MRKTGFLQLLREFFTSYEVPTDEDFYDLYPNPEPSLTYIDEFKGQKRIQWLNRWLEGVEMTLRIKNGQVLKLTNPMCVLISNYSLEECYHEALNRNPNAIDPTLS